MAYLDDHGVRFKNSPDSSTPLNETNLNKVQTDLADYTDNLSDAALSYALGLQNTPACSLRNAVPQNNSATFVPFPLGGSSALVFDTHNMHDTVTNNDRITIQVNGIYFANAWVSSQEFQGIRILLNGVQNVARTGIELANPGPTNPDVNNMSCSGMFSASVGHYIQLQVIGSKFTMANLQVFYVRPPVA